MYISKSSTYNYGPNNNKKMSLHNRQLRACLQGGGGPQVGEVIRFGGVINPHVHNYNLSFEFDDVYMIGGVTRGTLPHLSGGPASM